MYIIEGTRSERLDWLESNMHDKGTVSTEVRVIYVRTLL